MDIKFMNPETGSMLLEDGTVWNIADAVSEMTGVEPDPVIPKVPINTLVPRTGRMVMEDGRVINIANALKDWLAAGGGSGDNVANAIISKASGNPAIAKDSSENSMQGLKLFGKSRQAQTTGAQLLNVTDGTETKNGITVTRKGGKIYISGTPINTEGYEKFGVGSVSLESDEYTISVDTKALGIGMTIEGNITPSGVLNLTIDSLTNHVTANLTAGGSGNIYVNIDNSKGALNYTGLFMANKGSEALSWEPYTGGAPSPSPNYPQEITSIGEGGQVKADVMGGNILPPSKNSYVDFPLKKGSKLYLVTENNTPSNGGNVKFIDKNENIAWFGIDKGETKESITLQVDVKGFFNDLVSGVNHALFVGSDLPYEPYKTPQTLTLQTPNGLPGIPVSSGGNYTDADGQQWVCDEIDLARGKYVQRVKKEYLNGIPNFVETPDYPGRFWWMNNLNNSFKRGNNVAISSFAKWYTWANHGNKGDVFTISNKTLYYTPKDTMTSEEINAVFREMTASDNPPYVLGQLETPIETDLSQEEIAAYKALHTNYPTTVVTTDADPAPGIELGYVADVKNHLEQNYVKKADFKKLETRVSALESAAVQTI